MNSSQRERKHDVEFASHSHQGFGPEDVASAGQGPVGNSGRPFLDRLRDPLSHLLLLLGDESTGGAGWGNPMSAEVGDARSGQWRQQDLVRAGQFTDQPQLSSGCGQGPEVVFVQLTGTLKCHPCAGFVPDQQLGLRLSRGSEIPGVT